MAAIGAQVTYSECPDAPYYKIADTGDDARSFLGSLSAVIQSGVNTLIWAGDAGEFLPTLNLTPALPYPRNTTPGHGTPRGDQTAPS